MLLTALYTAAGLSAGIELREDVALSFVGASAATTAHQAVGVEEEPLAWASGAAVRWVGRVSPRALGADFIAGALAI